MGYKIGEMDAISADYARDGVVKIEGLLSLDEVAAVREALARYIDKLLPTIPAGDFVLESDGKSVRNLWRLNTHSGYFEKLSRQEKLLALIRPLVKSEPVTMGVESFNKPAQVGSAVPPHQDNAYFCLAPPDALTLWIAIDPVTEANGPVSYVRGSHVQGLRPHAASGVSGNSMGLVEETQTGDTYVGLLAPGDALIHHCETVHFSAPNATEHARCGLLIVYRGEHCVKDPALLANYVMAR